MFSEHFDHHVCAGDTIACEVDGFTITAQIVLDNHAEPPWEQEDGHGPVSDWTTRTKKPGERILTGDGQYCRYYDMQEATRLALRDGWGAPPWGPYKPGIAATMAVEDDYQALRGWCNDEWYYCGVVLIVSRGEVELDDHAASLWGVYANHPAGDCGYLTEVANELLPEAVKEGHRRLGQLRCITTA